MYGRLGLLLKRRQHVRHLTLYNAIQKHAERTLISDHEGSNFTGHDLLHRATDVARHITAGDLSKDLQGERIAVLCPPSHSYVTAQLAIWRQGGVHVPLAPTHATAEIEHILTHSKASVAIGHSDHGTELKSIAQKFGLKYIDMAEAPASDRQQVETAAPSIPDDRSALMIYTSGTTGRPKGVVHTHGSLQSQVSDMIGAWEWTSSDKILHVLPLHHVHGVINALLTPLSVGAHVQFAGRATKSETLLSKLLQSDATLFMAVPTIYVKLIEEYERLEQRDKQQATKRLSQYRLMVSGSAPLPATVMQRWKSISSQTLLERYGMTETGMVLTNPYRGERHVLCVGEPFPSVQVRIVNESNHECQADEEGELRVKGASLFKEYWNNLEATKSSFDEDGWFMTGDTAVFSSQQRSYRILGRTSQDILKSGGYKLSAIEIESVLSSNPDIAEVYVVGVADTTWGQRVGAVVKLKPNAPKMDVAGLKSWATPHLAPYKIPTLLVVIDEIPKNAMGKVNKKQLVQTCFPSQ